MKKKCNNPKDRVLLPVGNGFYVSHVLNVVLIAYYTIAEIGY